MSLPYYVALGLAAVPAGFIALLAAEAVSGSYRRRKWQARATALIDGMEARQLYRRILEDAQVADLEAAWDLPCAPGSWQ